MKIKFIANYTDDITIYKSMINCYAINDEYKKLLTFQDDYDLLGIFNGCNKNTKIVKKNSYGFLQEPIGNINYDRNLNKYCNKIFCQSSKMFDAKDIIQSPLCMFFSNADTYNKNNFLKENFNKPKKMCIFVSNISNPNNIYWKNHNYAKRLNLLSEILKSDLDIDIYGRGLAISDKRYKGSPSNKQSFLRDYEFSIAIENCCEENYISEKFFDCVLNNVVPIYYGAPNIDDIFGSNSYIKFNLDSSNVMDILKDVYYHKNNKFFEQQLNLIKQKYFIELNPIKKILEVI